jgi:hypothetical protein
MSQPATEATPRPSSGGKADQALSKKALGLPAWGWLLVAAGGGLLYWWYKNRQSSSSSTQAEQDAEDADETAGEVSPNDQAAAIQSEIQQLQGGVSTAQSAAGAAQHSANLAGKNAEKQAAVNRSQGAALKKLDASKDKAKTPPARKKPTPRKPAPKPPAGKVNPGGPIHRLPPVKSTVKKPAAPPKKAPAPVKRGK